MPLELEDAGVECLLDEIVDVREAAEILGISKAAVVHAVQLGRIRGKKVGRSWALVRRSVCEYEVAAVRVAAGKLARCSDLEHEES